jgi:hypothetical protein
VSVEDFRTALGLIEANPDACDFVGERAANVVRAAEEALGLRFPPAYREFLLRLGAGNVGSEEIYGVIDENFIDSSVPDGIWMTLRGRREWDLPHAFVVIYFDGGTSYYALDTSRFDETGECPVIAWTPGLSQEGDRLEEISHDFGSFLLEIGSLPAPALTP